MKNKNKDKAHLGNNNEETLDRESLAKENNASGVDKEDSGKQPQGEATKAIEELEKKAFEYDALWNKYLRVCADFDNVRKRWDKERQELIKFANTSLIKNLLVIVDEFEHALRAIKEHSQRDKIIEGIELTYNNLRNVLEKEGLKAIEARGKKFDPHFHEIVGQVENEEVEEHTVVEEIQKGYLLAGNLLRTSKVIISVSKAQEKNENDKGSNEGTKNSEGENKKEGKKE